MDGSGEAVHLTRFETALGTMALASTARGIVACALPGERRDKLVRWLTRHVPGAEIVHGEGRNGPAVRAVQDYLAGRRGVLDLPLDLRGTPFQRKVWRTLRRVPYGRTVSYAELARLCGHPGATRACGAANGSNPVPLFVPCHRVVGSDGSLGGFGGGQALKRKLLALEQRGVRDGMAQAG